MDFLPHHGLQAAASASPDLLSLPPEVRCMIYRWVFKDTRFEHPDLCWPPINPADRNEHHNSASAILRTCHALRAEATPYFYRDTCWIIDANVTGRRIAPPTWSNNTPLAFLASCVGHDKLALIQNVRR